MSQYERPQMTQSKQALSNMLQMRQRHPSPNAPFNIQQRMQMMQNQNPQQMQQQLQQRPGMINRPRMAGKPANMDMINQQMGTTTGMAMTGQQTPNQMMQAGNQQNMMNMNQNQGMMNQQNVMNQMGQQGMQSQQQINMMQRQNPQNPAMMQQQPQGNQMMGQQNMMQQNVGNQIGNIQAQIQQQQQQQQNVAGNQQQQQSGMFNPNQFTNFPGNQPGMGYQGGMQNQQQQQQQQGMMNNFQQNNPNVTAQQQIPNAEFFARRKQLMQQRAQQQQQQQAPNVTMNTNMGVGPQSGPLPPYRQQPGGKPMVNPATNNFQGMRMRQQMIMNQQQQQQGMLGGISVSRGRGTRMSLARKLI